MDQPKEPRQVINVRVRRDSKEAIEKRAKAWEMTASDYHRACLAYALANMPRSFAEGLRTRRG